MSSSSMFTPLRKRLLQLSHCEQVEAKVARKSYTLEDVRIVDHSSDEYYVSQERLLENAASSYEVNEDSQQLSTGMLSFAVYSGLCKFYAWFSSRREMKVENSEITLTSKENKNTHFIFTTSRLA